MKAYQFFIGANNSTRKLEIKKIKTITGSHFDGFTIHRTNGYWKGVEEASALVEVTTDKDPQSYIQELKRTLNQDAIAFRTLPTLTFA